MLFKRTPRSTPKASTGQQTLAEQLDALGIAHKELPPLSSTAVPPSIPDLQARYEAGAALIKADPHTTKINTTELRFLAYGLDFIDFARSGFGITLTLAESDVTAVEQIADNAHRAYVSRKMPNDRLEHWATGFAGYLGLLILTHKGGTWVSESPIPDAGPGIQVGNGDVYFVLSKAYRRIRDGDEDNLVHFYRSIPYQRN